MAGPLTISLAGAGTAEEREALLGTRPDRLIYASRPYFEFLAAVLPAHSSFILEARIENRLVGFLPAYVRDAAFGPVVNSLPFYGSHGGPVTGMSEEDLEENEVTLGLLAAFDAQCRSIGAVAATVIESPLFPLPSGAAETLGVTHFDERISQISPLPSASAEDEMEAEILSSIHQKTRNLVRKALKSNFEFEKTKDYDVLEAVVTLHTQRMAEIGGLAKPMPVIEKLVRRMEDGHHWSLWVAKKSGQLAAGLLNLEYGGTVEYFLPVFDPAFRSEQPLSGIIFTAMKEAAQRGCVRWNWGGTWLTQDEVYHFKSRWNAVDRKYRYFTRVYDERILSSSREELLRAYPYFYVAPFSALN